MVFTNSQISMVGIPIVGVDEEGLVTQACTMGHVKVEIIGATEMTTGALPEEAIMVKEVVISF